MKIQTKLDLHSIPYDLISGHIYIKHDGVEYFAQPQSKYLTKHLKSASGPQMLDVSPNGLLVPTFGQNSKTLESSANNQTSRYYCLEWLAVHICTTSVLLKYV